MIFHRLVESRRLLDHREGAHIITVRVPQGDDMGVAEKDFEKAFGFGHKFFHHKGHEGTQRFWVDFPTLRLYNQKQTVRQWGKILV